MDLTPIPRTFWHALSLAVLIATGGLVYIAHESSSVSIKFANATVELAKVKADNQAAADELLKQIAEFKSELAKSTASHPPPPAATNVTVPPHIKDDWGRVSKAKTDELNKLKSQVERTKSTVSQIALPKAF